MGLGRNQRDFHYLDDFRTVGSEAELICCALRTELLKDPHLLNQ